MKELRYHPLAEKEFKGLPVPVQLEFQDLDNKLSELGQLRKPEGERFQVIIIYLYEMRLRINSTQWRAFYGYVQGS
ncbi:MAG: hypothetical protein ACOCXT_04890 [Candidatus Dojkabacteria bacterium]